MVGAGAVVTRSVPANAIVVGNPATIVGYVEALSAKPVEAKTVASKGEGVTPTAVRGVTLHHLRTVADMRGTLSVGEFEHEIPSGHFVTSLYMAFLPWKLVVSTRTSSAINF